MSRRTLIDWMEFNHPVNNLCTLCGNGGIIDTRGIQSPAGTECGALNYCVCPNGRALKRQGADKAVGDAVGSGHFRLRGSPAEEAQAGQAEEAMKTGQKLKVTITKTSLGDQDYIQIMSEDQVTVNVVLVADEIRVTDHRPSGLAIPAPPKKGKR